jgi:hypothetical protein
MHWMPNELTSLPRHYTPAEINAIAKSVWKGTLRFGDQR